ncbi:MAG: type II secretion system F family protein [Phycisphaerae bacterium]|nr:type II secretion system F family protein [Phycisphaerae bacterium]MDW8260910.1 type II secretion system F family protein [Phycisphaerales bacterium]
MESILLPILVAGSVGLVVFAIWQVIGPLIDPSKRKLARRLAGQSHSGQENPQKAVSIVQDQATGLEARLLQIGIFKGLHRVLLQSFPDLSLLRFVQIMAATSLGAFAIVFLLTGKLLVAGVAMVIGLYLPIAVITGKRNRRQKTLAMQLPEALDFLGRILRAGHSFSTGLSMMGTELPSPLADEFRRAYDQHSLGVSVEDALKEMATRIDSSDFAFFVTATLIQRQTGGDLSEVLGNISGMMRQRTRLQQQVKAKTAEGRFTGYILTAFPAVLFVILYTINPEYAKVLVETSDGMMLLGTAFALQMLGLFAIRKITTVEV